MDLRIIGWLIVVGLAFNVAYQIGYSAGLTFANKKLDEIIARRDSATLEVRQMRKIDDPCYVCGFVGTLALLILLIVGTTAIHYFF